MKNTAIILSAGKGKRMGLTIPKQYMDLEGKPVLYYTLSAFQNSLCDEIIIVCAKDDISYVENDIVLKYSFDKVVDVVQGGDERFDSVYKGLEKAFGEYILIHDGARPFVTEKIINKCINEVSSIGACVAGMPVKDTIKEVSADGEIVNNPDRRRMWMAQTPQCFEKELVVSSYKRMFSYYKDKDIHNIRAPKDISGITDDAMVVDIFGGVKSKMIEASYNNIKITTPEDILVATKILNG